MPYNSNADSATLIADLIYDALLGAETVPIGAGDADFKLPDGSVFTYLDGEVNPYKFTDNLLKAEGALPKVVGSKVGREDDYTPTASQRNTIINRKGFGSYTEEEKEVAVPSDNWIKYTFEIVEGQTWSDGTPFSAEDIVFTFKYVLNNAGSFGAQASLLGMYSHSEASEDGKYISIYLGSHKTSDIKTIGNSIHILPKHIWENINKPRNEKNVANPVGTAAYKLAENGYIEGSSVTLELRGDYNFIGKSVSAKPPKYISVVQYGSVDIMLNELNAGRIDTIYEYIEIAKAEQIKANTGLYGNIKLASVPDEFVTTLLFNQQEGRYGDDAFGGKGKVFRQAVGLAINQASLIETVLFGNGIPASDGLVLNNQPHALFDENGVYEQHKFDVAAANKLLDDNGFAVSGSWRKSPQGEAITVKILALQTNERLVQALHQLFEAIKVNFEYEAGDAQYPENIKTANGSKFDAIINKVTFVTDKLLMFDARYGFYATANPTPRLYNYAGIDDPTLRNLILIMDNTGDTLVQFERSRDVQRYLAGTYYELPLYSSNTVSAYSDANFKGWVPSECYKVLNDNTIKYIQSV
jgi:peptide/nickel transport system substrate-binding protein